jgi:hypothetical protein
MASTSKGTGLSLSPNWHALGPEISPPFTEPRVHYLLYNSQPLSTLLSTNPKSVSYFVKIFFAVKNI